MLVINNTNNILDSCTTTNREEANLQSPKTTNFRIENDTHTEFDKVSTSYIYYYAIRTCYTIKS